MIQVMRYLQIMLQIQSSEITGGLSREELGRLVASRWTGDNSEKETKEHDGAEEEDNQDVPHSVQEDNDESYYSETDDDRQV